MHPGKVLIPGRYRPCGRQRFWPLRERMRIGRFAGAIVVHGRRWTFLFPLAVRLRFSVISSLRMPLVQRWGR